MFDLNTFSTDVDRDAVRVTPADVFGFLAAQRGPTVLRLPTGRRRGRRHAVPSARCTSFTSWARAQATRERIVLTGQS
jgi:hypothetical protein